MREAKLVNFWVMGPDLHSGAEIYIFSFRLPNNEVLHFESYGRDSVELGRLLSNVISKYPRLQNPVTREFNIPGMLCLYDYTHLDKFVIDLSKDFPYMEDVLCYAVHSS